MIKKKNVLLLEDTEETALYIKDVLKIYDLEIDHFESPTESFSVLDKADLIILDYNLPEMDGIEYLKFLNKNFPQIPVIMITGHGSESVCLHAFRLGVRDYLKKPFSPSELREIVNRCVQESMSRTERSKKLMDVSANVLNKLYLSKNFIDSNIEKKLELNDVLKIACMSKPTFNKYFKLAFDSSFKDYCLRKKVEKAKYLLQEGSLSISEIAYQLGFTDLSHFTKIFKKITGISPSAFAPK
ncbi:MAG: DNA-binding response regulator [Nitrospirota bacterium]|nr:MAG: DNA-binding response regulator [Nitrospirota bacterium]